MIILRSELGTALPLSFSLLLSAWLFGNSLGLAFIYKGWRGPEPSREQELIYEEGSAI